MIVDGRVIGIYQVDWPRASGTFKVDVGVGATSLFWVYVDMRPPVWVTSYLNASAWVFWVWVIMYDDRDVLCAAAWRMWYVLVAARH